MSTWKRQPRFRRDGSITRQYRRPVYTDEDRRTGALLADESVPDSEKDRLIAQSLESAELQAKREAVERERERQRLEAVCVQEWVTAVHRRGWK